MNGNLSLIYSAIDATKKVILDGDKTQAEKCGWELCNCFEENFVADKEEDYTPELCRLQLDALATLLDLHIMRGDPYHFFPWQRNMFFPIIAHHKDKHPGERNHQDLHHHS